jgi:hypothetical protein
VVEEIINNSNIDKLALTIQLIKMLRPSFTKRLDTAIIRIKGNISNSLLRINFNGTFDKNRHIIIKNPYTKNNPGYFIGVNKITSSNINEKRILNLAFTLCMGLDKFAYVSINACLIYYPC